MLLSSGDPTLATSPYASSKCRPDREVNHVPRKCGVVLITTRSDGGHDPVARGGHDVVELVEVRDVSPQAATGLSRCAYIWISNIERSSATRENRCE